jgi:hypothetical protein
MRPRTSSRRSAFCVFSPASGPTGFVPGSRVDWFEADLGPERMSLAERLRALVARDVRPPRPVELFAYERTMLGVSD